MLACIGKLVGNTFEELIGIETILVLVALILKPNIVFDISFLLSTKDDVQYDTPLDRHSDILPGLPLDPLTTLHTSFAQKEFPYASLWRIFRPTLGSSLETSITSHEHTKRALST